MKCVCVYVSVVSVLERRIFFELPGEETSFLAVVKVSWVQQGVISREEKVSVVCFKLVARIVQKRCVRDS